MNFKGNKIIAGLLLGRAGSIGFPGKNTYPVLGRPLMVYPMLAGLNSKYIDKLFFSTDAEDYKQIGRSYGLEIIDRPPELATKEALGEDAFVHGFKIIKEFYQKHGKELELLVLFFCNSATILSETIDEGIEILRNRPEYDSAITASPYNMWSPLRARRETKEGLLQPFVPFETFGDPRTLNCDRDSQGDVWFADMGVSIVRPHCLENLSKGLLPQKWMGQKIFPLKQSGGCDVDFEWQVPGVVYWLEKHGFTEKTTPYDFKNLKLPVKEHLSGLIRIKNPQESRLQFLRLDKNENLISLPAETLNKIKELISADFISAYPELDDLYSKLSKRLGIPQECLYITAGSDAGIKATFEVFVKPSDKVLLLEPTYAMYNVYVKMFQAEAVKIKYANDLTLDYKTIINQIEAEKPKLVCLANPNSPTGTIIVPDEIEQIISRAAINGVIVLIDEAYFPYYEKTAINLINRYPNLLITRTFSKASGIAAARIGYIVAGKQMIESLHKVRPMYEANAFGVKLTEFLLDNPQITENNIRQTSNGKKYLEQSLRALNMIFFESHANFINIKVGSYEKSVQIERQMRHDGVLIKSGIQNTPLEDSIRVSIGNIEQMKIFIEAFIKINSGIGYSENDVLLEYYANNRNCWTKLYTSEKIVFEKIFSKINQPTSVLDVGCAGGGLGIALAEKINLQNYIGVDICKKSIDFARELYSGKRINNKFYNQDIIDCDSINDEHFDLVISLSCADWSDKTLRIINACWERVKVGGYFIISLRLTAEKGINDILKSYQYVWFKENERIPSGAAKVNYIVFNVVEAINLLSNLLPKPNKIFSYGEFHPPSFSARTPFEKLFFAVFAIEKGANNLSAPILELIWPDEFKKAV